MKYEHGKKVVLNYWQKFKLCILHIKHKGKFSLYEHGIHICSCHIVVKIVFSIQEESEIMSIQQIKY